MSLIIYTNVLLMFMKCYISLFHGAVDILAILDEGISIVVAGIEGSCSYTLNERGTQAL